MLRSGIVLRSCAMRIFRYSYRLAVGEKGRASMSFYKEYTDHGMCGLEFLDKSGREHACYLQTGHEGNHLCDCGAELNIEKKGEEQQ